MDYLKQKNEFALGNSDYNPYEKGDFSFISTQMMAAFLTDAFLALEEHDLWEFFDQEQESYIWDNSPKMQEIQKYCKFYSTDHSGGSWGWTIQNMKLLRQKGWKEYTRFHLLEAYKRNNKLKVQIPTKNLGNVIKVKEINQNSSHQGKPFEGLL